MVLWIPACAWSCPENHSSIHIQARCSILLRILVQIRCEGGTSVMMMMSEMLVWTFLFGVMAGMTNSRLIILTCVWLLLLLSTCLWICVKCDVEWQRSPAAFSGLTLPSGDSALRRSEFRVLSPLDCKWPQLKLDSRSAYVWSKDESGSDEG